MSLRIKQAESMKSEFISSVSHELRTPLTAITGWAETIMSGEARDEGDVRKGMAIIASEARRLSGMVEELLEFSRIEDGRFTLSVEPMDIKAELEDAVYTYHEFLAAKDIAVYHTDCEEEFGPIPFKAAKASDNVFFNDANNYINEGKYVVSWAFNYTPNVDTWRAAVVAAMTQYSAGGSWDDVVTAFVQGWAAQYANQ